MSQLDGATGIAASSAPRKRFASRRLPLLAALGVVALMITIAILAPVLAPHPPNQQNLLARLQPPGAVIMGTKYLLGTDQLGRDLLSRIMYGARVSLLVATLSVLVSLSLGSFLGMTAGYFGGVVDTLIMRLVDIVLSIPALLLAIITVAVLGPGLQNLILILGFTRWPRYARVAYGQTLSVRKRPFVEASQALGAPNRRVLFRHIAPNIAGPLLVVATLEFGLMVLFEAGLSFLGLGVQPPTASWGAILNVGRAYVGSAWWIATFPGISLFLLVFAVNLIGDAASERLDPMASTSKRRQP